MKIITSFYDMCQEARKHAGKKHPDKCWISTYGLWVRGDTFGMLKYMATTGVTVRIAVGLPYMTECADGCQSCKKKLELKRSAITHEARLLDRIGIHVSLREELHAKGIAFSDGTVIIGGFNLTNSGFTDMAILMKDNRIMKHIKKVVG